MRRHKTEEHRTYKPCAKYALSKCDFDGDCMYNNTLLNDNEHICYRNIEIKSKEIS